MIGAASYGQTTIISPSRPCSETRPSMGGNPRVVLDDQLPQRQRAHQKKKKKKKMNTIPPSHAATTRRSQARNGRDDHAGRDPDITPTA